MSVPLWPQALPLPSRAGWQAQFQDPRIAKPTDAGPPGYRARFSSVARSVMLKINVSRDGKAVFDAFLRDELHMGATPFWMPDPSTQGWALLGSSGAQLTRTDGAPLTLSARWLCLIGAEMPVETIQGVRFEIAFSVSVMP